MKELCKHDLLPEWCGICRRLPPAEFENEVVAHNLDIVDNLLSWQN